MSAKLTVTFSHLLLAPGAERAGTALAMEPGGLVVRGRLSAGGRGWRLSGTARKHRRQIQVYVVARPGQDARPIDLEDHEYELKVAGLSGGAYGLRVTHVFLESASSSGDGPAQLVALERAVHVPVPAASDLPDLTARVLNVVFALLAATAGA